ncbi:hypothetical protein JG687_00018407, partial [Phytophthora cactorum]
MPKKGARASKPSSSATKAKVVKGMTKKKERSSKRKPRARSPRDDAPGYPRFRWGKLRFSWPDDIELTCKCGKGEGSSESFFDWTAEDEATYKHACREGSSLRARKPIDYIFAAQGIAKDDASDEDYDPECDPDDDLEEIPRTVRTAVQRETLGPVVGSGPDTGGSAKNNTDKPKEVDVDARSKRDGKQHVTGFEASMRRFVQAARVEAEEAASSHKAAQDDTETVSGQVNVEIIDDDAEPIVESNA